MESIRLHRGFTLIELMVVFTIIVTISMVVLTSQSSFNKTLILSNTAYDIALALRSSQTYGLGSRGLNNSTVGTVTNAGYGLHFSNGSHDSFILFADTSPGASCSTPDCRPGDYVYTSNADAMIGQPYQINNGITIKDFCAYAGSSVSCEYAHGGGLSSLDIVFARPNPDAHVSADGSSYNGGACITIASASAPNGPYRFVSVAPSGEIAANAAPCP